MAFIPKRLKDIFTRKAKSSAIPAPASAQSAMPAVPLYSMPSPIRDRTAKLARYQQTEGYYLFELNLRYITEMKEEPHKGCKMVLAQSPEMDFYLAIIGHSPLSGVRALAAAIDGTLKKDFGMEETEIYFHDRQSGKYINAKDDFIGLPPTGKQFQIAVIPKGCAWRPPVAHARKTPRGTSPLLRPPFPQQ